MSGKAVLVSLLLLSVAGYYFLNRAPIHPNIILILVDTLRADHLGYNGYERNTSPNLDIFAGENRVFRNAFSSSAWTPPSVASLFTGMYASVHQHMPRARASKLGGHFTTLDESFETLAERLQAEGYATGGVTANPLISKKYGLQQGFDQYYSPGRERGDVITKRAKSYLSKLRPKDKPFFFYLHYLDPHDPYKPPEGFNNFSGSLKRRYGPKELDAIARYDGEIRFVDSQIGELFTSLKKQQLYDDAIIIFVADHGEQFRERGFLGHGDSLHSEEIHIPLIIKAPKFHGEVSEVVSIVDVYPTILKLLGIESKVPLQGVPLDDEDNLKHRSGVMTEIFRHHNLKAFTTNSGFRMIFEFSPEQKLRVPSLGKAIKTEFFNLKLDPLEVRPEGTSDSAILEQAEALYSEIGRQYGKHSLSEVPENEEMLRELKTLGYF